ncbi:MAG: hypothetical protein WDN50_22420 [Bradyrhizobium sp.]
MPKLFVAELRLTSTSFIPISAPASAGDNVHYVVPSDHRGDLIGFADTEVSVFERAGRSLQGLFRMAIVTLQQIRRVRPDIVHIHSTFAGLVIRPILF